MAITYNNLYLDIRQQFLRAGLPDPTLESRELVCCASGKSREELSRDGRLYVPDTVERQVRRLAQRHLDGEPVAYLIGARLGAMTLLAPTALGVAAMACGWLVLMLLFHLGMGRRK